jgi:2-methylcitrate dehydratase PrpD
MSKSSAFPDEHFKALAQLASSIRIDNLPNTVTAEGRRILVDCISAILAGASQKPVEALAQQLTSGSIRPESTVIGTPYRCDAAWAALVNATAGVWHHLDPGNRFTGGNPAIHAVAAGMVVAEKMRLSGKKLLEAVIAGYEIGARVGLATTLRAGMHPHGSWTVVGAAVAAGLLMGYNDADLVEVINLSTSLNLASSSQAANEGATVLNAFAGISAAMGILAATLKSNGFSAERDGIGTVFGSIAGVFYDAEKAIEDIGTRWEIERGYHTDFGCDRRIQPALDALIILMEKGDISAADVDKVTVQTFCEAAKFNQVSPKNPLAAKLSIPHVLASYLIIKKPGLAAFHESTLDDKKIRDLAERILVIEDPELTRRTPTQWPARLTVRLRNGQQRCHTVYLPSGEFDTNPVEDEALTEKLRQFMPDSCPVQAVDQLVDLLWKIETVADVTEVTRLLSAQR